MIHLFERPCPAGWIYPCSLQNISDRIARLPEEDLRGLWAVGLVPATRKDNNAYARYFFTEQPVIHVYSFPDILQFRLPPHVKPADIDRDFCMEQRYGLTTEREGSRYICLWKADDLRNFVVEHVLLHEVGHHVYHSRRKQQGYAYRPRTVESEQFAEAYAKRHYDRQDAR